MQDRLSTQVLDNGAIRYAVYDESGTFLRYEYLLPADEPTQPGTPLNKATLLSDSTATALGMLGDSDTSSTEPTVDGALDLYANERKNIGKMQYPDGTYKEIVPTGQKTLSVNTQITSYYYTQRSGSSYSNYFNKRAISFSPDGGKCVILTGYTYNYSGSVSYLDAKVILMDPNEKTPTLYEAEYPFSDIKFSYNQYSVHAFNDHAIVVANKDSTMYVAVYAITDASIELVKSQEIQAEMGASISPTENLSSQYIPYDDQSEPYIVAPHLQAGNAVFINKSTLDITCKILIQNNFTTSFYNTSAVPFKDTVYVSYSTANVSGGYTYYIDKLTRDGSLTRLLTLSSGAAVGTGLTVDPENKKVYATFSIKSNNTYTRYLWTYDIEAVETSLATIVNNQYIQYYRGSIYNQLMNAIFHPETGTFTNLPNVLDFCPTIYYWFGRVSGSENFNALYSVAPKKINFGTETIAHVIQHRIFKSMYTNDSYDFETLMFGDIQEFVVVKE